MAWEISHTPEAWDAAARNLREWDRERLIEALTDDAFEAAEEAGDDDPQAAADARWLDVNELPHDLLVDAALGCIEEHGTCSNGGHAFWIDRQGFHTVPVS